MSTNNVHNDLLVAAAQQVLGGIDVEPHGEKSLGEEWRGRVYLSVPSGLDNAMAFVAKVCEEMRAGRTTACVLVSHDGDTDSTVSTTAFAAAKASCRLSDDHNAYYFGSNPMRFRDVFIKFGGVAPAGAAKVNGGRLVGAL